jgi:hypothetical protein
MVQGIFAGLCVMVRTADGKEVLRVVRKVEYGRIFCGVDGDDDVVCLGFPSEDVRPATQFDAQKGSE